MNDFEIMLIEDVFILAFAESEKSNRPTGNNQRMRQLLDFFSGSLASLGQGSWITDPKNTDTFSDFKNFDHRIRDMHNQNEASIFVKDDWKTTKKRTASIKASPR